jgi:hypothetical protein
MKRAMTKLTLLAALTLSLAAGTASAQSYEFQVEHEHLLRSCRGTLVVAPGGIEFKSAQPDHSRVWQYTELQQVKVTSKSALELLTYEDEKRLAGRDRVYKFKLLAGEITPEVSAQLMARVTRPLVTSIPPVADGTPRFEAPVKHLHPFGGCAGTLSIFADRVTFESSDKPEHSRFWRYADIENFSQSERFRFEIAASEAGFGGPRSYNFQLKAALPAGAYDYVWARVYPSKFRRYESW